MSATQKVGFSCIRIWFISSYLDENISEIAAELGRQQNPSLAGDPNKVLSKY